MGITFELKTRKKEKARLEGAASGYNGHTDEANGNGLSHVDDDEDHERTGLLGNER